VYGIEHGEKVSVLRDLASPCRMRGSDIVMGSYSDSGREVQCLKS